MICQEIVVKDKVKKKKTSQICIEEGCCKGSSYGLKDQKRQYCSKHKKENMIDVAHQI